MRAAPRDDEALRRYLLARYEAEAGASATKPEPDAPHPIVITLDQVASERVTWLWPGRIPAGKLTLLVGDPEAGKSTLALDIAARLTMGRPMPDGSPCEVGDVLFCTLEDGLADTVRPRLDAAGADCARVHSVTAIMEADDDGRPRGERAVELPTDLPHLETIIRARRVRFVVFDPLKAYMAGGVNEWRDGDVRRVLGPLAGSAERTGAAVLGILHLTKNASAPAQYRTSGSIAFTGAARSVLLAAPDPQAPDSGRRLLAPLKASLCERAPTLAYRIVPADGTRDGPARVEWLGESSTTARQALAAAADDDEKTAVEEVTDWLAGLLRDGPRPAREVLRQARAEGFKERTLDRARARLGVRSSPSGFGGPRLLSLPDPPVSAKNPSVRHIQNMAETGKVGGDWTPPPGAGDAWEPPAWLTGEGV